MWVGTKDGGECWALWFDSLSACFHLHNSWNSSVVHLGFTVGSIMAREQKEAPTCGEGGEQEREREREGEDEPRKSEDDSEYVTQHQYTSDSEVMTPLNKSLSLQILISEFGYLSA